MKFALQNHIYMSSMCAKEFSNSNFNERVIGKVSIFQEIAKISHIHKNLIFLKYNWQLIDQLHLLYKFHGSSMRGILFFTILPVVNC